MLLLRIKLVPERLGLAWKYAFIASTETRVQVNGSCKYPLGTGRLVNTYLITN